MRRQAGEALALQANFAGTRRVDTGDEIDQRRLAGAIGPDEAADLAGGDADRDVFRRRQSAEAFGEALGLEQRRHQTSRPRSPKSPVGRTSRMAMTRRKP